MGYPGGVEPAPDEPLDLADPKPGAGDAERPDLAGPELGPGDPEPMVEVTPLGDSSDALELAEPVERPQDREPAAPEPRPRPEPERTSGSEPDAPPSAHPDAAPEGPLVLARDVPGALAWGAALLAVAGMFLGPVLLLFLLLRPGLSQVAAAVGPLAEGPGGALAVVGTVVVLCLAPGPAFLGLCAWARRRYGQATLAGDTLEVEVALALVGRDACLPREEVTGWRTTPYGVRLEVGGRSRLADALAPLVVPAEAEADQARVVGWLERTAPAPDAPGRAFGRPAPAWLTAAFVAAFTTLLVPGATVFAIRYGTSDLAWFLLGASVLPAASLFLLDRWVLVPRLRRLHVGQRAVLYGDVRVPWRELTGWWTGAGAVALEAGRRRLLWAGDPGDVARVGELLRERAADREAPGPLSWASPRLRRRRDVAAVAAVGLAFALGLGAAASDQLPIYDVAVLADDDGNEVRLRHHVASGEGVALAVATGPGPPRWRSDVPAEVAAAVLTAWPQAQSGPYESIPAYLDAACGESAGPELADWIAGRTSRRTWDVDDGVWRLTWAVDAGEVAWVIVAPSGVGVGVLGWGGFDHRGAPDARPADGAVLFLEPVRAPEAVLVSPDDADPTAPLPEFEELLAATRRAEAGVPVRKATGLVLGRLWGQLPDPEPAGPGPR